MQNSAFVCKYEAAPRDKAFNKPWSGDDVAPAILTRKYRGVDIEQNYIDRKLIFDRSGPF